MAIIKIEKKVKTVRVPHTAYDYRRHGKTERIETSYSAKVTALSAVDRVVALHLGELNTIVHGLRLMTAALELNGGHEYETNNFKRLAERLTALKDAPLYAEPQVVADANIEAAP